MSLRRLLAPEVVNGLFEEHAEQQYHRSLLFSDLTYLVSGVVIVAPILAFPGLAKLMVDGVQVRDMPLVQACGMIFCGTYVVLILISDIASIVSNPRLRHPK